MSLTVPELVARAERRRTLPAPEARRAIRRSAGISAAELGRALGVSEAAVLTWERGTREPQGANLDAYVEALSLLDRA